MKSIYNILKAHLKGTITLIWGRKLNAIPRVKFIYKVL